MFWGEGGAQINRCLIGDQQNIIQETENTITVVLTRNILIYKLENHVTTIYFSKLCLCDFVHLVTMAISNCHFDSINEQLLGTLEMLVIKLRKMKGLFSNRKLILNNCKPHQREYNMKRKIFLA